jgi:two-component system phosphate regulon sensor histidine kinase PhoR
LTTPFGFEIIKSMLLESYPEEAERLKKHQVFYEWVTYFILIFTYSLTYLPIGVPIHRLGTDLLFASVGIFTILIYRVIPFERRSGLIRYTVKQRFFLIQLSDHYFASAAIYLTGGVDSPFWYVYILALIAGSMALPAGALIVAGIMSISLYLLTVAFLTPYFTGLYEIGLTSQMVVVPVVSIFAVVLTYVVAKDLNQEISRIRKLANDLKKKAFELTGERNKLNTVVSSVADGIFVLDKEKRFSFVNKAGKDILNLREEDLINKKFDDVIVATDVQTNKQVKGAQVCPQRVVTEDKILFGPAELRVKVKANKEVWARLTSSGIKEGPDVDIGCICTFQDVSKEKEFEQMKLDFVAMSAHELRTPLTAARGYLSILMEEMSTKLNTEQQGWVKKAFVSTSNLAALVENLLSISRIEKRNLKLEFIQVDWQEVLQEVVNDFKPQADQKEIDIALNVKEALPKISVDRFRISEVLSNLLANAVTYSKPGSKIEISSQVEFFRVSGALEQGSKGTGLGLYISKAIVEMHKGRIWVKSKVGVGSTFGFSLPLRQSQLEKGKITTKDYPSA